MYVKMCSFTQMVSEECSHHTQRSEPFFMISLEVKNKSSLAEALTLFVQGDRLDHENKYNCSDCKKKVNNITLGIK